MELNSVKEDSGAAVPTPDGSAGEIDVLIAGAGPTGLALAIDLTRRGLRALVVERQRTLSPAPVAPATSRAPWRSTTTSACWTPSWRRAARTRR